jgi:flagellar protein FliS
MITNRPLDAYYTEKILSADPLELVRLLYDEARKQVATARRRLSERDILGRSTAISKAMEILVELAGALDHKHAPELSGRLAGLYDYMGRRLLQANFEQADAPLAEVRGLLDTLGDAWKKVATPGAPTAARDVPAPSGRNRSEYAPTLALQG